MPLFQKINIDADTEILIWEIIESEDYLKNNITIKASTKLRLTNMKSTAHRCAFLAVRHLLQLKGITDDDLNYNVDGKPILKNGLHISITHAHQFAAIAVSNNKIGIDIELQREKIMRIAEKFIQYEKDYLFTDNADLYLKQLTTIWAAKEASYKMYSEAHLSLKNNIHVLPFEANDSFCKINLCIQNKRSTEILGHIFPIKNYILVVTKAHE